MWHNVLAPLDESDFKSSYLDPEGDWQIGREELIQHYQVVANTFGFDFSIFSRPQQFFDYEAELAAVAFDREIFEPKVFVHPQQYLRCDEAFKHLQKEFQGLSIKLGAEVLKFTEKGGEVCIRYRDIRNSSIDEQCARRAILCAGALNNPSIIYNSLDSKSLPMLGKCLMDHPMGNMFQFRYPKKTKAPLFSALKVRRKVHVKVALKLAQKVREQYDLPNSAFYLRPSFSEGPDDKTERLKLDLLTVRKKLLKGRFPIKEAMSLSSNLNMLRQVMQYKTGLSSSHYLSDCMLVTEQRPSIHSMVELHRDVGLRGGTCSTEVKWRISEVDLKHVRALGDLIDEYLVDRNGARMTYSKDLVPWKDRLASAAHHLGTVRMSRDADLGCVDRNLLLHNCENTFVCDGSVFPTSGNANPTFTSMALANRLGEYLSND